MKKNSPIVLGLSFLFSLGVGFGTTYMVKKMQSGAGDSSEKPVVAQSSSSAQPSATPTTVSQPVEEEPKDSVINPPEPPVVEEKAAEEKLTPKEVKPKMTAAMFESALNRKSQGILGTNPNTTPTVTFKSDDPDFGTQTCSPQEIFEKLRMGNWKCVHVSSVTTNNKGQITSAVISVEKKSEDGGFGDE